MTKPSPFSKTLLSDIANTVRSELVALLEVHSNGWAHDEIPDHWRPAVLELAERGIIELVEGHWRLVKTQEPKNPTNPKKKEAHRKMKINLKKRELGVTLQVALTAHVELHSIKRDKSGRPVLLAGRMEFTDNEGSSGTKGVKFKLQGQQLQLEDEHAVFSALVGEMLLADIAQQLDYIAEFAMSAAEETAEGKGE